MFNIRESEKRPSRLHHLAHMVALLGPPPVDVLQRSSIASEYFNSDGECCFHMTMPLAKNMLNTLPIGSWKGTIDIPKTNLEESEYNLEGENKALFLAFVRRMLM